MRLRKKAIHAKEVSSKLIDGWQGGLIVVVIAMIMVLLVVPRPVIPGDVPHPAPNLVALSRLGDLDAQRAIEAEKTALPFDVRALGEAIRSFGSL